MGTESQQGPVIGLSDTALGDGWTRQETTMATTTRNTTPKVAKAMDEIAAKVAALRQRHPGMSKDAAVLVVLSDDPALYDRTLVETATEVETATATDDLSRAVLDRMDADLATARARVVLASGQERSAAGAFARVFSEIPHLYEAWVRTKEREGGRR